MLLGSGETNLCDHRFSHQIVKAAFRGLASYFNTLLCGYFSLLFVTIAVTMLFCLYSLLITTITATSSDCNFFSYVRLPLLQIHFSCFFYRVNHMYRKYPKLSMVFVCFLILIFFDAGELEMHLTWSFEVFILLWLWHHTTLLIHLLHSHEKNST